jgi:Flp pilus assembly pilin Flp
MENIRHRILGAYLRMVEVDGQGYTEYALILAAIAIAALTALSGLGTNIGKALSNVAGQV